MRNTIVTIKIHYISWTIKLILELITAFYLDVLTLICPFFDQKPHQSPLLCLPTAPHPDYYPVFNLNTTITLILRPSNPKILRLNPPRPHRQCEDQSVLTSQKCLFPQRKRRFWPSIRNVHVERETLAYCEQCIWMFLSGSGVCGCPQRAETRRLLFALVASNRRFCLVNLSFS